jgi:hypothetical protein
LIACTKCYPGQYTSAMNLAISCGPSGKASCPTRQSSIYSDPGPLGAAYPAFYANDGLLPPQNALFTHTNADARPWWMVDFGSSQAVGSVTIYNRVPGATCCAGRLNGFQVWVGNNSTFYGSSNVMCYVSTAADDVAHNVYPYVQSFSCSGVGQYLFVTLPGTQFLHMAEVVINAQPGHFHHTLYDNAVLVLQATFQNRVRSRHDL